jgi:hypothetical protein
MRGALLLASALDGVQQGLRDTLRWMGHAGIRTSEHDVYVCGFTEG